MVFSKCFLRGTWNLRWDRGETNEHLTVINRRRVTGTKEEEEKGCEGVTVPGHLSTRQSWEAFAETGMEWVGGNETE